MQKARSASIPTTMMRSAMNDDAQRKQADDLARISRLTLDDYERRADSFWQGTKDHDVTQNYDALLSHLEGDGPFTLLDFGCGPGRDLRYFADLGHTAVGLDGCPRFCAMARAHSGCEVLQQDFLALSLPRARFD